VGALGADRAGKAGAYPGQVVGAIIPALGVGGRVWVGLTSFGVGARVGGYGRGGRGSSLWLGMLVPDGRCNNAPGTEG
jgi:flagellar biosynthesis/type III secretory pathway ATPase